MAEKPADTTETPGAPLTGRSVLVTRTREQAHALIDPLESRGAEVLAMPVLQTVDPEDWLPVDEAIRTIGTYDWIVFTSTNGVDQFLRRFKTVGGSHDDLVTTCIAAVGSATAHRLRSAGYPPSIVPEDFRAEGLVHEFREMGASPSRRVLIPRAEEARETLPDALREMGWDVDVVVVYRTAPAEPDPAVISRLRRGSVDVATFTSGAMASSFLDLIDAAGLKRDKVMKGFIIASIGPITTEALRVLGYRADIEAGESTMDALVDAIVAYFAEGDVEAPGSGRGA